MIGAPPRRPTSVPAVEDAEVVVGAAAGLSRHPTDAGARRTTLSPEQSKPWTSVFNMGAGHFATMAASAAANTLRLDDMNTQCWRTHDAGKAWTEINTGIAAGAV